METIESTEEPSCTDKCRSIQHGSAVCAIGTRGMDKEIVILWSRVCRNYGHVRDSFGRTALHIAASYGKFKAVQWLITQKGSNISAKDAFNGYTPLHRTLYFGQIHVARALISLGASLTSQDNEGLFPLDIPLRDRIEYVFPHEEDIDVSSSLNQEETRVLTDLLVWGTNLNYNLGIGNQSEKSTPEILEVRSPGLSFYPQTILKVVLQNYHSVFVTNNHEIFTCGVGRGGRLGTGSEETSMVPNLVPRFTNTNGHCYDVAAGTDHTLFLMSSGRVYACGLNENFVLGIHPSPQKLLTPKPITKLIDVADRVCKGKDDSCIASIGIGICCSSIHSVYFVDDRLFTWGLNEGQLGHNVDYGSPIVLPKEVQYLAPPRDSWSDVMKVVCNDLATVFRADDRVFVLYNNECRRLRFGRMHPVVQIGVVGGIKSSNTRVRETKAKDEEGASYLKYSDTPLAVILLSGIGRLLIWRENTMGRITGPHEKWYDGTVTRVVFSIGRPLNIVKFCVNASSIMIVTKDGFAYKSGWTSGASPHIVPLGKDLTGKADDPEGAFRVTGKNRHNWPDDIDITSAPMEQLKLRRIANVYYGLTVCSDPKGNNHAVIQISHTEVAKTCFPSASTPDVFLTTANGKFGRSDNWSGELDSLGRVQSCSTTKLNADLELLLLEASCEDSIHDVEFQVFFNTYPAHRYMIRVSCPVLYSLIQKSYIDVLPVKVIVPNCDVFSFSQILQFIYTDTCDLIERVKKNPHPPTTEDALKLLSLAAKHFKLEELVFRLKFLEVVEGGILRIKSNEVDQAGGILHFLRFPTLPKDFNPQDKDLSDITLVSFDGTEFRVHVCILVARMEYFRSMFSAHFWTESGSRRMDMPLKSDTLKAMIEYVYDLQISHMSVMTGLEGQVDILRAADQYLLPGLVREIEPHIARWATFKNVVEIFRIASAFNAFQLKRYCLRLMCTNLAMFLENRLFDPLSEDEMAEVTDHYRKTHPRISSYRVLTPDPNAPDHAVYDEAAKLPNPDFDDFVSGGDFELVQRKKAGKQHKAKPRTRGLSETEMNSALMEDQLADFNVKGSAASNVNAAKEKDNSGAWTKIEAPRRKTSLRKSFSEEEKKTSVGNTQTSAIQSGPAQAPQAPKKPAPLQPKTSVILPPKAQTMKKENEAMRALEVKFESALEFPCLGEIPMIPMPSMLSYVKEPDQIPSASQAPPKGKKKTKWVSVPMASAAQQSPGTSATAANGNVGGPSVMTSINSPWKIPIPSKSPVAPKVVQLDDIIKEETQKNENFQRAMQKPLASLQIEDQAVEQITKVYSTEKIREGSERLKVERIGSQEFANPTWVTRAKNTPAATTGAGKKGSSGRS